MSLELEIAKLSDAINKLADLQNILVSMALKADKSDKEPEPVKPAKPTTKTPTPAAKVAPEPVEEVSEFDDFETIEEEVSEITVEDVKELAKSLLTKKKVSQNEIVAQINSLGGVKLADLDGNVAALTRLAKFLNSKK